MEDHEFSSDDLVKMQATTSQLLRHAFTNAELIGLLSNADKLRVIDPLKHITIQDVIAVVAPLHTAMFVTEQRHITLEMKQLAEQQTRIAERQEDIAKQIKRSVDESTDVAKHVRTLTIIIGVFTLISVVATVIACIPALKELI